MALSKLTLQRIARERAQAIRKASNPRDNTDDDAGDTQDRPNGYPMGTIGAETR